MSQSSWIMGGSRMDFEFDSAGGRAVGSKVILRGRILSVEEVVTVHAPPILKTWETIGTPNLFVIGHYRMSFETTSRGETTTLRVFIDHAPREASSTRWLGQIFGAAYARWCTMRVTDDAARHFH